MDVDDCRQDVWADLLRTLPGFSVDASRGRFSTWLYTVVRSKATDILRKRSRQPVDQAGSTLLAAMPGRDADPAQQCQQKSEREAVHRAISQLRHIASEQSFRVVQLRWLEQRDGPEWSFLRVSPPE